MPDQRDPGDEAPEAKALKDSPLIVTRGDGVPLPDQEQALRDFKAQFDTPNRVYVEITGWHEGVATLGKLLSCILVDAIHHQRDRGVGDSVIGNVDAHIEDFVRQLADKDRESDMLRLAVEDERNSRIVAERGYKVQCERLDAERSVSKALEQRLGDVAGRKVALAVAHGDVPPDQYEARRRIEVNGVRDFVAAVRSQLMPRQMGDANAGQLSGAVNASAQRSR